MHWNTQLEADFCIEAVQGARFAGVWLPSCYTTWGDTTRACQF